MMSKTHYAVGIATALAVVQPREINECAVALIGGAIGGVLADNDTIDHDYEADALIGQLLAMFTTLVVLVIDYFFSLGIIQSIFEKRIIAIIGLIFFIVLYIKGYNSNHRTFTHSFLALILYSVALGLIYAPVALPTAIGYLSHLSLDVLNKKDVPLLYPAKFGICFKLCYASKTANKVFMYMGFIIAIILLIKSIAFSVGII